MNVDAFRTYLEERHQSRNGTPFSPKVASDCISRCRRVEAIIGMDLDRIVQDHAPEDVAKLIEARRDESVGSRVLRDLQTAARRYCEYRQLEA